MNLIHKQQFLVVLIFLGLLWATPGQGTTPALAATEHAPLKGTFSGVGVNFSGHLTLLGDFEGIIDSTAVPPTAVWTAANGDTVTNDTISFVLVEEIRPNVFKYVQTIGITGGTGRFSNATGYAIATGTINLATAEYDGRLEGYISQPGPGS